MEELIIKLKKKKKKNFCIKTLIFFIFLTFVFPFIGFESLTDIDQIRNIFVLNEVGHIKYTVGCPRTEKKSKLWDVLYPLICKAHLTWEVGLPKKKMGKVHSNERPNGRNSILGEDQPGGRKLLKWYTFYPHIECSITTLLAALM